MFRKTSEVSTKFKVLSGPEIETLADYYGQGALVVQSNASRRRVVDPIVGAYDNVIASSDDKVGISMSTDSNRFGEWVGKEPNRTCIEFRANPGLENTRHLLKLIEAYSVWLSNEKILIKQQITQQGLVRTASRKKYYLNISDFVNYYNELATTKIKLKMTSPAEAFDEERDSTRFSTDANWALELDFKDLNQEHDSAVYITQYNMSIPIGCIFEPEVKRAFPIMEQFSLVRKEKEATSSFNVNRPHEKFQKYEEDIFSAAVQLADKFFSQQRISKFAMGARDFLRGMAYEIAMISTSENYLIDLFEEDALAIKEQLLDEDASLHVIATSLSRTLFKFIFPYFIKATLADFFAKLDSREKSLLKAISKTQIKVFCQNAIKLANGGIGNDTENLWYFAEKQKCNSFIDLFDLFYEQTFQGAYLAPIYAASDPVGLLTDRFISSKNLGSKKEPLHALVVELRFPAQGRQEYLDVKNLCDDFNVKHKEILQKYGEKIISCRQLLASSKKPRSEELSVVSDSSESSLRRNAAEEEVTRAPIGSGFFDRKRKDIDKEDGQQEIKRVRQIA